VRTLVECPNNVEHHGAAGWSGSLREEKGGVEIEIGADRPFALHLLDASRFIATGPRCDGVLIADRGSAGLTCFLELKGAIDPDRADHPFEQIQGAIEHFAPAPHGPQAHGEEHHVAWRAGDDIPTAPRGRGRARAISVAPDHTVAGVVVVVRGGTRHPPRWLTIAGRTIFVAVIQKHGARGRVTMKLDDVEAALGL
jgi:hypothetical protein